MSTSRLITATAILALVAGTGVADAATRRKPAPKPVCNLIQDAKGDATELIATTGPSDPALDIVTADIASDATRVTVVWRLNNLAGDSTSWPAGRGYQTQFKARGDTIILQAISAPSGTLWQNGSGTGKVDTAKNEVRMTVPINKLRAVFKVGDKLTDISAVTWRTTANTEYKVGRVDVGNTVAPHYYVSGTKSCVTVGA